MSRKPNSIRASEMLAVFELGREKQHTLVVGQWGSTGEIPLIKLEVRGARVAILGYEEAELLRDTLNEWLDGWIFEDWDEEVDDVEEVT